MMRAGPQKLCPLCECDAANSKHHLIPQMVWRGQQHRKALLRKFGMSKQELRQNTEWICRDCHREIHRQLAERELIQFASLERLRAQEQIRKYLNYKRKRYGLPPLAP